MPNLDEAQVEAIAKKHLEGQDIQINLISFDDDMGFWKVDLGGYTINVNDDDGLVYEIDPCRD